MTKRGETDIKLRTEHSGHRQRHQRMNSGINFRMPLCRRGHAKQGVDFETGRAGRRSRAIPGSKTCGLRGGAFTSVSFHTRSGRQMFQLACRGHFRALAPVFHRRYGN